MPSDIAFTISSILRRRIRHLRFARTIIAARLLPFLLLLPVLMMADSVGRLMMLADQLHRGRLATSDDAD
jgi:hypothetical protein